MLTDVDKPIDKLEDLTEDSPSFLGCGENSATWPWLLLSKASLKRIGWMWDPA
jgi:hypothetical protein